MRAIFFSIAVVFSLVPVPAPAAPPLGADEAVTIAIENHPHVASARARAERAEAAVRRTTEAWIPRVTGFAGIQHSDASGESTATSTTTGLFPSTTILSQSFSGSENRAQFGLATEGLLWDFGVTGASRDASELAYEAHLAAVDDARRDVRRQVLRAYYQRLRSRRLHDAANDARAVSERAVEAAGDGRTLASVKARLAHAKAVETVLEQREALEAAEASLAAALGDRGAAGRELVDDVTLAPVDLSLEKAIELSLESRPDLVELERSLESRRANLRTAESSRWPSLNAYFSATDLEALDSGDLDRLTVLSGGLNFRFSTGALLAKPRIDEAQARIPEYEARLAAARQTAREEVTRAYASLFRKIERVRVRRKLAEEAEALHEKQKGRGGSQASEAYRLAWDSRISLIEALYDAKVAEVELAHAIGR